MQTVQSFHDIILSLGLNRIWSKNWFMSYPTLGQIFISKKWFKKDRSLIIAPILLHNNYLIYLFKIALSWTDINDKKKENREKACKCKCEFVTQHIALIEIPVAFVEFLLTNLNNLFATTHLDRSNWQKKSCENAYCHRSRKCERCSPNSLRPISYFGSIGELYVLGVKTPKPQNPKTPCDIFLF